MRLCVSVSAILRSALSLSLSKASFTSQRSINLSSNPFLHTQINCHCRTRTRTIMSESKPRVFVSRPDIPKAALDILTQRCDLVMWNEERPVPRDYMLKNVSGVDGIFCLITDKIDAEMLDAAGPQLKVVGTMSVGVDHVDMAAVKSRGIRLGYTPNVLTDATAETTIIVLLAAARRVFEAHQELLNGGWGKSAWGPLYLCGHGLSGSTVGIYGMGRIGAAVKDRLKAFQVARFIYSGRKKKDDVTDAEFVDFDTLCKESDFVIVTCAMTPETKEIFNERAFSMMKSNAVFVNSSRGGTVQQDALINALKTNKIFAAGLDVMTPEPLPEGHELTKLKNCVVLPHIGSATIQARTAMATLTAKNIIAALDGKTMPESLC